ncbi:O-antigen ligase family protein [Nocardioides sp.]|uniref:O-antigen ligase family protein n=1 Tax=Nocardioides sp. TaxID=35761 RepID=UPI002634971B|nr:O-antigen ligase family protein [Nocardioides sp.]
MSVATRPVGPTVPLVFTTERAAIVLVVLVWLRLMANLVVLSFTADKHFVAVGEAEPSSHLADLAGRLFLALALGWAAAVIIYRINELPRVGLWRITVFLAPWLVLLLRDAYDGHVGASAVPLLFIVAALAALRPGRPTLEALGVLVIITALIALVWGVAFPEAAILREADGTVRESAKALLPHLGLLQGQFTSENNLAQYLALGLPFVLLVRPRWFAALGVVACAIALVWTSSRGGLLTAGVVGVLALVLYAVRSWPAAVAWCSGLALLAAATVCVWLPLHSWSDEAFTARAGIWRISTQEWFTNADLFGFGSQWFETMARNATSSLNAAAYHGHNQFVQFGVTGGVLLVVVGACWLLALGLVSLRPSAPEQRTAGLVLVAIVVSGFFEVPLGFVDRWSFWAVTLVPLAILLFGPPRRSATPLDAWRRP